MNEFYEITKDKPPSDSLVAAVKLVPQKGTALDLGCGAGRDTRYLLSQGFKVTAVDRDPETESLIKHLPHQENLHYVNSNFNNFEFGEYDLINAQYTLPFNPPDSFDEMFDNLKKSMKAGGVFTGQLFGVNDEWNKEGSKLTFHTKDEAEMLLEGLTIVEFKEEERWICRKRHPETLACLKYYCKETHNFIILRLIEL